MFTKQIIRSLLSSPIAFHPIFGRLTGSVASGVFLSQLFYWSDRTKHADGWLYKTFEEWNKETCLSRREWENARKTLVEMDIIQCQRRGLDPKLWYRLDLDKLFDAIENFIKRENPPTKPPQSTKTVKPSQIPDVTSGISEISPLSHLTLAMSDMTSGGVICDNGSYIQRIQSENKTESSSCAATQKTPQTPNSGEEDFSPNQNLEIKIKSLTPCSTLVTRSVVQSQEFEVLSGVNKKPYELTQRDFMWIAGVYRENKPLNWGCDAPVLHKKRLSILRDVYEAVGNDMARLKTLFTNALRYVSEQLPNAGIDYFFNDCNFVGMGERYQNERIFQPTKQLQKAIDNSVENQMLISQVLMKKGVI